MDNQIWSWVLGLTGVVGFWFAGKKYWWAWYVNIVSQFLWVTYGLITNQLGFVFSSAIYFVVFSKNATMWTKEYFKKTKSSEAISTITNVEGSIYKEKNESR